MNASGTLLDYASPAGPAMPTGLRRWWWLLTTPSWQIKRAEAGRAEAVRITQLHATLAVEAMRHGFVLDQMLIERPPGDYYRIYLDLRRAGRCFRISFAQDCGHDDYGGILSESRLALRILIERGSLDPIDPDA